MTKEGRLVIPFIGPLVLPFCSLSCLLIMVMGAFAAPPAPTLEHGMLAARARVLSNPGVDVLRQWQAEPQGVGFSALPAARQAAVPAVKSR